MAVGAIFSSGRSRLESLFGCRFGFFLRAAFDVAAVVFGHLSSHDGFEGDAADEVGPDDVQHLQHQQQKVKEPPGRVRPDDVPALEERRVQNPEGVNDQSRPGEDHTEHHKQEVT